MVTNVFDKNNIVLDPSATVNHGIPDYIAGTGRYL